MRADGDVRIRAGSLRHPITIYNAAAPTSPPTYNDAGQVLVATPFAVNVMAQIAPQRAGITVRAGQQVTETGIPITIRYMAGVSSSMTITSQISGAQYLINGIINIDERNVVLELQCIAFGNQT